MGVAIGDEEDDWWYLEEKKIEQRDGQILVDQAGDEVDGSLGYGIVVGWCL